MRTRINAFATILPRTIAVAPRRPDRGVAIVLVIVAVAAAAVIGSAYVASQLNAPQVVGNVNSGIQARYIADSGADLATAIMECETFDWRTAQSNGVLVDNLAIGGGSVSIMVKDISGEDPDQDCEYPVVVTKGTMGRMKQMVGMQVHTPRKEIIAENVDVDLSEFAAFGGASIDLMSGWITRWPASPMADLGLPVKVGTNAVTSGALKIADSASAPDAIGYVMATASATTITDATNSARPIRRENFSNNEPVMLPAPPTPNLAGLVYAPKLSVNINTVLTQAPVEDLRYTFITINGGDLTLDLGGASRTIAMSSALTIQNGSTLRVVNGHLDLVVLGQFSLWSGSAIEIGSDASLRIFAGGTMYVDQSVIGLPADIARSTPDARNGLEEYHDPNRCTIYRLTSINSVDITPVDGIAGTWVWSDTAVKSWIISPNSFVCGRIYGPNKVSLSIDNRSAVFGSVAARNIVIANQSAIYYDHCLDERTGYTNPDSRLYAGPLDLRDDIRLLLTDLDEGTLGAILALLAGPDPAPVAIDPFAPTPRDKERVARRWWKRYGVQVKRDRKSAVETVIANDG